MDLQDLFCKINQQHFDGFLEPPLLLWNHRLRSCAGKFTPGSRKWIEIYPPKIEIAHYLLEEPAGLQLIEDTLGHETIHYWLWIRKKPYGHTHEFLKKMKLMGVQRYNPVPRLRKFKYLYECPHCKQQVPSRKIMNHHACAPCCKKYTQGQYDSKFRFILTQGQSS